MNPSNIQQVSQNQEVQSFLSCWAGAEILSGLITRRRNELKLETTQKLSQTSTTQQSFEIPETEMQELSREAARASTYYVREYLNVSQEASSTQQTGTRERRAG